ncbi:MAG TPA: DUF6609 family protein [Rhizomicrobium sp.]|nr:DUF6609 family protein [Rhizomicrobium sp.]
MLLTGISLLGWVHTIACLIALCTGACVLAAQKGTRGHRLLGWWYATATAAQALTAMGVYRFDIGIRPLHTGPHIFGIFHWLAIAMLSLVVLAIFAARRQRRAVWAHVHAQAMLASTYILIGGSINEAFVRILPLRSLALSLSPHARNPINSLLAAEFQTASTVIWLALAIWFFIKVNRDRSPLVFTRGYPLRYAGGPLLLCMGSGILGGALLGNIGYGLLIGMGTGFIAARIGARKAAPVWGRPSITQLRVLITVIGLEFLIFGVLGRSGAFAKMDRSTIWAISLTIVGVHFLLMRWSHGPWIAALGAAVLAWLGLGIAAHLPLAAIAAGDGLLKLSFGAAMAWPLLKVRSAPEYPPGSRPHPADSAA